MVCLTVSGQNANLLRAFTCLHHKVICNKAFLIWLGNVAVAPTRMEGYSSASIRGFVYSQELPDFTTEGPYPES